MDSELLSAVCREHEMDHLSAPIKAACLRFVNTVLGNIIHNDKTFGVDSRSFSMENAEVLMALAYLWGTRDAQLRAKK